MSHRQAIPCWKPLLPPPSPTHQAAASWEGKTALLNMRASSIFMQMIALSSQAAFYIHLLRISVVAGLLLGLFSFCSVQGDLYDPILISVTADSMCGHEAEVSQKLVCEHAHPLILCHVFQNN